MIREKRKYKPWGKKKRRTELLRLRALPLIQRKIERITRIIWAKKLYGYVMEDMTLKPDNGQKKNPMSM